MPSNSNSQFQPAYAGMDGFIGLSRSTTDLGVTKPHIFKDVDGKWCYWGPAYCLDTRDYVRDLNGYTPYRDR